MPSSMGRFRVCGLRLGPLNAGAFLFRIYSSLRVPLRGLKGFVARVLGSGLLIIVLGAS